MLVFLLFVLQAVPGLEPGGAAGNVGKTIGGTSDYNHNLRSHSYVAPLRSASSRSMSIDLS